MCRIPVHDEGSSTGGILRASLSMEEKQNVLTGCQPKCGVLSRVKFLWARIGNPLSLRREQAANLTSIVWPLSSPTDCCVVPCYIHHIVYDRTMATIHGCVYLGLPPFGDVV
jgi:hypothetical protein